MARSKKTQTGEAGSKTTASSAQRRRPVKITSSVALLERTVSNLRDSMIERLGRIERRLS